MASTEGFGPGFEEEIWSRTGACLMFIEGGKLNFDFDKAEHALICDYAVEHPAQAGLIQSLILEREITTLDEILALLPIMKNSHPVVREGTL
jgi:hypothetical protein